MYRRVAGAKKNCCSDNQLQRQSAGPSSPAHPLLRLQRSIGNNATQRLIRSPYIQTKLQRTNSASAATQRTSPPPVNIHTHGSGGSPLPAPTRTFFEPRFGTDFQQVRVHSDARAADSARAINAKAFTFGHNIVFGHGQYAPESRAGRELLAHELTHVVQQSGSDANTRGPGISKAGQSVQRDLLDDVTEGLTDAGESLAAGAESAASTVASEVGSVVESGVDAVTPAVSTGAQTVGGIVESAQQQLGPVLEAVPPVDQPDEASHGFQIDWNSPPALILKSWALQLDPQIFRDARGKSPATLFSQIDFPPHILEAAEELARQSRSDVAAAPSPVSTPSPVSGPVSGPVSTGPVSGIRPVAGAGGGIGLGGAAVFVIGFIIGFLLPFLIGYVIEHSEETSKEPDPDVKSPPGGVGPITDPSGDAGAPTPSSKPTPKPDPDPERDPREEKCRETFRESANNPTHANPLECDGISLEQVLEQNLRKPKFMLDNPGRFKFGKPRVSQNVEDAEACGGGPGQTFHVPIIDKVTNSPVEDIEVSVFECACCDEEGKLSVVFERPHISGGK